jgi:hypothetical protein
MKLYRYRNRFGLPSYRKYRNAQIAGNTRKLDKQWIDENSIQWLSEIILREIGQPQFGLCHGTRRGKEQEWFAKYLGCNVLGTEISSTATKFPNTIEWDFHDVKKEWIANCDFVYSNSWDHAYDPSKMFKTWMSCVRPGGVLVLTHTKAQTVITQTDPLGMTLDELRDFLNLLGNRTWRLFVPNGAPDVVTTFTNAQGNLVSLACNHLFAHRPW